MEQYVLNMKTKMAKKIVLCILKYTKYVHYTTIHSLAYFCLRLKKIPVSYLEFECSNCGVYSKYIDRALMEVVPSIKKGVIKTSCFHIEELEIKDSDYFNNLCSLSEIQYSSFKEIARVIGIRTSISKIILVHKYVATMDWVCLKTRCLIEVQENEDKFSKKILIPDKEKLKLYLQVLGLSMNTNLFNVCFSRLLRLKFKYIK